MRKIIYSIVFISLVGIVFWACSDDSKTTEPETEIPEVFITIPTGSFSMGQTDVATPVHTVNVTRSFYLGKYEVTQKLWMSIMGSIPASDDGIGDNYPVYNLIWYEILVYCNKRSKADGLTPCYTINGSTNPTTWGSIPTGSNSSWDAVVCDFNANGYRLPTEAEWEYAAQYNDERIYPWGVEVPTSVLCNYNSSSGKTTKIGSYPNGNSKLGLCDMAGNVQEWVWDWSANYTTLEQTNPTGGISSFYRVIRGGGSYSNYGEIRCAHRHAFFPQGRGDCSGFRLARTK